MSRALTYPRIVRVVGSNTGRVFGAFLTPFEQCEEVNVMQVILSDIVKSNYCYYDLHSGCVKGLDLPDTKVCSKCVDDAYQEIC